MENRILAGLHSKSEVLPDAVGSLFYFFFEMQVFNICFTGK